MGKSYFKEMRISILSILFCLICLHNPALAGEALDEANSAFTYKGLPVHPFLVKEFLNWLSDDRPPMITTVDVSAAFNTNKYQNDEVENQDDWWGVEWQEDLEITTAYCSFGYQWLGKLEDGTHVLEVADWGGGSGVFMDLLFVTFSEGEILWKGKKEKQLLMSIVGTYTLGDRYEGEIKVLPNKVIIPASSSYVGGGSIDEEVELNF